MIRWIENVSKSDIILGHHSDLGENVMLIQISDPPGDHPKPKRQFREVHQFDFLDAEDEDGFDDLAVTAYAPYYVSIFNGNGDGTFQNPVDYVLAKSNSVLYIVSDDFNIFNFQ